MSLCLSQEMTNNHELGVLTRLGSRLQLWISRWRQRDELTHWSDRDLP